MKAFLPVLSLFVARILSSETFVTNTFLTPRLRSTSIPRCLSEKKVSFSNARNSSAVCWIEPLSKEALTASLECGYNTFLFRNETSLSEWQGLGRFQALAVRDGRILDEKNCDIGCWVKLNGADGQKEALSLAGHEELVVLDAQDWKIIPAENMIASYQPTRTRLLAVVSTAMEAKVLLETLEVGTDGVVLRTHSPSEPLAMWKLMQNKDLPHETLTECEVRTSIIAASSPPLTSAAGVRIGQVTSVTAVGMGDRVCVDTCSLLGEDEGLLVGSAGQGLFLVLSEAARSDYIESRPFRVNAGPVHSYCLCPAGKTRWPLPRRGVRVLARLAGT
jgi:hypothetical protein